MLVYYIPNTSTMCRSRFASVMDHTGPGKLLLVAWPKRYLAKTSIMRQNITPAATQWYRMLLLATYRLRRRPYCCLVFSERDLTFTFACEFTFTFAICYRPSVCLSSVCNAAPYSGGWNFRQYFYGIWYPSHPLTSTENFTEIVPGKPLRRGS